ncbi:MAG TPA: YebC/PmpR family DNA-binding transcriptional regulator [Clostridiaceae bacterium]|nr:YebC/PmpR family DNA-binding transcriptional regulator [Clostridiaceae bacterium]
MAGHSKWSNIKRRKEAVDSKRGKIFTKLGREIAVAVKAGGPNPETNSSLADAIARAKANNMSNDSIQRSISKADKSGEGDDFEDVLYEGYGPGGVAIMVRTLTDNRNRTAGDVRHIFDKYGGNLGTHGCVAFQFERKGSLILDREVYADEEQVFLDALELGAEDIEATEEMFEIITAPEEYHKVREGLTESGYEFSDVSLAPQPLNWVDLNDEEQIQQMEKLIEAMEDHDDVQDVYHNWNQEI